MDRDSAFGQRHTYISAETGPLGSIMFLSPRHACTRGLQYSVCLSVSQSVIHSITQQIADVEDGGLLKIETSIKMLHWTWENIFLLPTVILLHNSLGGVPESLNWSSHWNYLVGECLPHLTFLIKTAIYVYFFIALALYWLAWATQQHIDTIPSKYSLGLCNS